MEEQLKRIKSDKYYYYASTWGSIYRRKLDGTYKELGFVDKDGYMCVKIRREGKKKSIPVHRLIAESFIDNPEGKKCIDHIDANKLNNCANNLRWCTAKENNEYRKEQGIEFLNSKSGIRNNPISCKYNGKEYKSLYQLAKHLAKQNCRSIAYEQKTITKRLKHNHKLYGHEIITE